MHVKGFTITPTTDASGDVTSYSDTIHHGEVLAIIYTKDDYAAGVDLDITLEDTGQQLWAEDDVNASKTVYPRIQVHDTTGTALTLDGTRIASTRIPVYRERVKVVIDEGGDTKSGTFLVLVDGA